MEALSFEYQDSSNESVAEYRGLTIKAVQDSDCSNPWEDSDGFAPLVYYSLGNHGLTDLAGSYELERPLSRFTDRQLALKWAPLCRALDVDSAEAERDVRESQAAYGGALAGYRRDYLEERLSDMRPSGRAWGAACDYFEALESIYQLIGIAALDFQRNGYSQGDSVRGLLVALPEWRKAMGIKPSAAMADDLEAQADVFGAWAFGDCYGFQIEREGETLDSCYGFIGSDFQKSGLADAAKEAADYILSAAAKRKAERLKELIRNRVPLALRPALLVEAAALRI